MVWCEWKPSVWTLPTAPPPLSCCSWPPSLSPPIYLNSCSSGLGPQKTRSPNLSLFLAKIYIVISISSLSFESFHSQLEMWGGLSVLWRHCTSSCCQSLPLLVSVHPKISHIGKNWRIQPGQGSPSCPTIPSSEKSNEGGRRGAYCVVKVSSSEHSPSLQLLHGIGDITLVTLNWEPRHSKQTSKFRKAEDNLHWLSPERKHAREAT